RRVISPFSGQPGTVRATWTCTAPPSMATPFTIPRSTIERRSSGSCTGRRASMTRGSVTATTAYATERMEPTPLSAADFSAAVTAITSAFGDPTRRDIYLWIRDGEHATEGA